MQNKRKNFAVRATAGALSLSLVLGMVPAGIYAYADPKKEMTKQEQKSDNLHLAPKTPPTAVRDAAAPEDTSTDADAKNAVHGFVGVLVGGDINADFHDA